MTLSRREFAFAVPSAALLAGLRTAPSGDDPLGVRKDFPALDEITFLNTAYSGLLAQPVVDTGREWLESRARQEYYVPQWLEKTDETRRLFARFIGAGEDEIGFLYATSEGENVVVNSLDWKAGDNVVVNDLVYPSTPVILRRLEQTQGVELRMANHRSGATTIEDFARLVDDRTRLVSVALVSNISGYRHDMRALAELAHSHGAYLYADAVQAVGMGPLDVKALDIDFLTTGCYKWLGAGFGVAPFYVRRELLDRIHPQNVGWRVEKRLGGYEYQHYRTAKKFEYASLAFGEVYQLAAALKYLESIGLDRIEAQSLALVEQLRKGLGARGFHILTPSGTRSSIVSFYIKEESPAAERILEDAKIKVSLQTGDRTDAYGGTAPLTRVRVSLSFFNNAGEVDRFLEVSAKLGTT
jgi:selenocysteine lyase/cysteine desulfurase